MSLRHVDGTLYVGDSLAPATLEKDAFVVTVMKEPVEETDVHIPLEDSPDFDQAQFKKALDTVCKKLTDGERVVVHCNAGINRSPAVAAAAHCTLTDDGAGQAMTKAKCGFHKIAPYFREEIKRQCGERPVVDMTMDEKS